MFPLILTHPQWDPVALNLGPVQAHWYGLMYLLAFAAAYIVTGKQIGRAHV